MKNMGKYFGTDGFRGEANIGLTVEHISDGISGRSTRHGLSSEKIREEAVICLSMRWQQD